MEVNGSLNSQKYNNKVLELKEKIKEERNFYVATYENLGDKWFDFEDAIRDELFNGMEDKCKDQWFDKFDAIYKNMDFKLERRIFHHIYLNIYEHLPEDLDCECDEDLNDEIEYDEDYEIIDLSICDDIKDDYLNVFIYLLGKYLEKNARYLSKMNYKKFLQIRYDLAFCELKYEDEFLDSLFKWPNEVSLQSHLKSLEKARNMAMKSKKEDKSKLFLKFWSQYEKDIQEETIKNVEDQLKKIEDFYNCDNYMKMINFLYLKSILISSINENKDLVMNKLIEYQGKNDLLNKYIKELLEYDYSEDKVYKLSLFKN